MPQCGCFHSYNLTKTGLNDYELTVCVEGQVDLENLLGSAGVARVVSEELEIFAKKYTLTVVRDETKLDEFLGLMSSRIIIDLGPDLEECYALAPYTVFNEEEGERTRLGALLYRAKYRGDEDAWGELHAELEAFIKQHPRLKHVTTIAVCPKSDTSTLDVALKWAESIAANRHWQLVQAERIRQTSPQKDMDEGETEEDVAARVANSVEVKSVGSGAKVLIVDDTIRSGGTMKEMARALLMAGADEVFGLSVAKDAKFTFGGVDLSKEQWR